MECFVSSQMTDTYKKSSDIRAKTTVTGELQGPLTEMISCKVVLMHHIVSTSHMFLVGVIDLAGLFVP